MNTNKFIRLFYRKTPNRIISFLQESPLFENLYINELVKLRKILRISTYKSDEIIFTPDSEQNGIFLILVGKAHVLKKIKGKNPAEGLTRLLWRCPQCRELEALVEKGRFISYQRKSFSTNNLVTLSWKNSGTAYSIWRINGLYLWGNRITNPSLINFQELEDVQQRKIHFFKFSFITVLHVLKC